MHYVVKVDRLGGKAEIRGIGLGDERISRFEIVAKDFISQSALPLRIPISESGEEDRSSLPAKLKEVFISPSRIQGQSFSVFPKMGTSCINREVDLASLFKTTIIQKLIPNLAKEGYEEAPNNSGAIEASRVRAQREEEHEERRQPRPHPVHDDSLPQPARPYPIHDPLAAGPHRPIPAGDFPPPGFEDEYEINRPPYGMPVGGRPPFNIGYDDLNPQGLGPTDPLRGSFVGGGGLPRPGAGAGMHPTFDDPMFGGRGGQIGSYDPAAPPGARYDPLGPGDGPQRGTGGGFPGSRGLGGRPHNPFGGFGGNDFI